MLLAVSRVNESVPRFLVEGIRRRIGELTDRKVAVLGLAFKKDSDDERDSLSHKLVRLLERRLANVATTTRTSQMPYAVVRRRRTGRRRRRRRHEPLRVHAAGRVAGGSGPRPPTTV